MELAFIVGIVLVIFSIILHEVAHGYMADLLGDPTARYSGRLTLNPLPHIDPVGSVLLPGILALTGSSFLIGWAKPVPYNPYNLKNQRWGEALVGFAGPATNILIAVVLGLMLRFFGDAMNPAAIQPVAMAVLANLSLAILNLIPIPPLDGSKILKSLLPAPLAYSYGGLERLTYALGPFGLIGVLMLFVYVLSGPVSAFVFSLFYLIVGVG
jgi:Zn-dependent protease